MKDRIFWRALAWVCTVLVVATACGPGHSSEASGEPTASEKVAAADGFAGTVAVVDVRLFDGTEVLPKATVVFRDGKISAVGVDSAVPLGATVIDGRGRTLLPGLIDSHTHSWGDALERAVVFGVTTQLDMFTAPSFMAAKQGEQATGSALRRADLFSAGVLATAPGGHGTQFGIAIPTLTTPDQAQGWVEERIEEGSDFIKLVLEDGQLFDGEIPTLSPETLRAVIAEAKKRDLLTVTHVHTLAAARTAIAAGSDGLAHLFVDQGADDELVRAAQQSGLFVVPTLTVLESVAGTASGQSLTTDERLAPYLTTAEIESLNRAFPSRDLSFATAEATVASLHRARVPILAGSDAPNPGTTHGASLHRELELLVSAGLAPVEALRAATSVPATVFALSDRGRVAVGLAADLLLVKGDPTVDIAHTRAIVGVWKNGLPIERQAISQEERDEAATLRAGSKPRREVGMVSRFEHGVSAEYGFGWTPSTDSFLGGNSTVEIGWLQPGAGGEDGALRIEGEIKEGYAYPWAGAMFFPGSAPMEAVDLVGATVLRFDARGPGAIRVLFFAESLGQIPGQANLTASEKWTELEVDLSTIAGLKMDGLQAFLISSGAPSGPFELHIDNIAFE